MEKLGAGAFGVVMRVISKEAGREFADKVMKRAEAEAAGKLDRLLREIEIWQKPTHPNILRLIEVVETADELHLITEICRGGELFDQLDAVDTFSEHECRLVVAQIAGAVAHLHLAHGIAHCDIKPQNILCRSSKVTDAGCIKLSDFGAAQLFAAGAADAFVETCGTLEYYAPELCENLISRQRGGDVSAATPYGPAVDLWALGCVAYELLCGEPPFWSKDDSEQVRLILAHDLAFPDECFAAVSAPAKELIRLLLAAEPARRRLAIDGASVDDPQISWLAVSRRARDDSSQVRRSFSGGPRVGQQRSVARRRASGARRRGRTTTRWCAGRRVARRPAARRRRSSPLSHSELGGRPAGRRRVDRARWLSGSTRPLTTTRWCRKTTRRANSAPSPLKARRRPRRPRARCRSQ